MKSTNLKKSNYGLGLAIGIPIGIPVGMILGNIAYGPGIGIVLGIILGSIFNKFSKGKLSETKTDTIKKNTKILILLLGFGLIIFVATLLIYLINLQNAGNM